MASIFTKIIRGDFPSYKIAEDDRFYAFLDINPVAKGHTLVIPKEEIDYIFDLPDELLGDLTIFAKKVGLAIEKEVDCARIGMTDRKSTRLNSSHVAISYAVFCLK